jgi:O-antigen/teichoic acid export membrane protein
VLALTDAEYLGGYRILPYVAGASALLGFQYWYLSAFMFRKKMVFYTLSVGVGAAVNIGLNFLLVPRYGYPAAAVTSLIGYAVVLVVMVPISRRHFVWRFPGASLLRVTAAAAVMGLAIGGLRWATDLPDWLDVGGGVIVGVAVYAVALLGSGEISTAELATVRRRLGRGRRESD